MVAVEQGKLLAGKTVVVTGANRGIGLAVVKELLAKGNTVYATARSASKATGLTELASTSDGKLVVTELDVASEESTKTWAQHLKELGVEKIDVVFNNAGVLVEGYKNHEAIEIDDFLNSFKVNTLGAFVVTRELHRASLIGDGTIVLNVSTIMASLTFSGFDDFQVLAYRSSKAALNILNRHYALALVKEGITSIVVHPGYVKTDMSGHAETAIEPEASAKGLIAVVEKGADELTHDVLYSYDGSIIPW